MEILNDNTFLGLVDAIIANPEDYDSLSILSDFLEENGYDEFTCSLLKNRERCFRVSIYKEVLTDDEWDHSFDIYDEDTSFEEVIKALRDDDYSSNFPITPDTAKGVWFITDRKTDYGISIVFTFYIELPKTFGYKPIPSIIMWLIAKVGHVKGA